MPPFIRPKILMMKVYSCRVGAGHHHIVEPELSKAYFSKHCWGVQCEIVMKQYKQRSTVDLYRRTPYHRSPSSL